MTTRTRFVLAYVLLALIPLTFAATFLIAPSLFHRPPPKVWPIDKSAWGQQSSSPILCGHKTCGLNIFLVLGPQSDKTARVELDTTWKGPGLRIIDHPPFQQTDTLGATPTENPCATIFSNPYVVVGALAKGCQPTSADPRSTFTLLIANRSDTPRVVEVQVYP